MIICGIDPGPSESAAVWYDGPGNRVVTAQDIDNEELLVNLRAIMSDYEHPLRYDHLVVERVIGFNQRASGQLMQTAFLAGRFVEAGCGQALDRKTIVRHLCGTQTGGDPEVRQAVMFRWGTDPKVVFGVSSAPGPLFGIVKHKMAALAAAVVGYEKLKLEARIAR